MQSGSRRKRRRGFRPNDYVVGRLPSMRKQYTVWDLAVEGCGVRISGSTRPCVISVRVGQRKKFETIGRVIPDSPYEYLRELAMKRIGELKRARLPRSARGALLSVPLATPTDDPSDDSSTNRLPWRYTGRSPPIGRASLPQPARQHVRVDPSSPAT